MDDQLASSTPTILVSLPQNDPAMAAAAVDAGADGLKVHLNVSHRASGNTFGTVEEESSAVEDVAAFDVPVGVVPGQDLRTIERTIPGLRELPVDFVDAYAHDMPPGLLGDPAFDVWVAPSSEYSHDEVVALDRLDVDVIELALQPKDRYGDRLSTRDLASYLDVADRIEHPTVLPSQLAITPDDAALLAQHGITNFLLGVIVIGSTPEEIAETVAAFRSRLDDRDGGADR